MILSSVLPEKRWMSSICTLGPRRPSRHLVPEGFCEDRCPSSSLLRAADRYAYTGCGSTAYCYLIYWGRANTYTHKKTLSVECLSRANSWSLSGCACPCPAVPVQLVPTQLSLSSWPIPAGVYEPA